MSASGAIKFVSAGTVGDLNVGAKVACVNTFLDGPLYFLERPRPGVLDPALLRARGGRAVLLFLSPEVAGAHLEALPAGATVGRADDFRGKEELLEAALARGADRIWLDAAPGGEPELTYPTARALAYVRSFKRGSACL